MKFSWKYLFAYIIRCYVMIKGRSEVFRKKSLMEPNETFFLKKTQNN